MPLISFWKSNAAQVSELSIEQIVATAGDGSLRDGSACSSELREYFSQVPSRKLAEYVEHCLATSFQKGGMVLQDLVNELGRRLEYEVTNGRYQGTHNSIGFDGIWKSPDGHSIIIETKTTDAYRISLDTLIDYRTRLYRSEQLNSTSSVLIVVGREDTGELEAQVRGSRHAWDIRLISADALIKLVQLKENSESPETVRKIRNLLTPMEYTRLDDLVDAMFTTATDVEEDAASPDTELSNPERDVPTTADSEASKYHYQFTDGALIQSKRDQMIDAVSKKTGAKFIKKSRALFWDAEHKTRIAATVSKRYERSDAYRYWYAYHPQWDEFLNQGDLAFFVLGGIDIPIAFALPWKVIHEVLPLLNQTVGERTYWHIHIGEQSAGRYELYLPKRATNLSLAEFSVPLDQSSHHAFYEENSD